MSRSTLKLPVKPASSTSDSGEIRRTTVRKVAGRRGSAPKRTPEADISQTRGFARPRASLPQLAEPTSTPPNQQNQPSVKEPVAKVYPKRGIARSTGARALPPERSSIDVPAPPLRDKPITAGKLPNDDLRPRLAYLITQKCGCSRREADDWIENGWVRVDGAVINTLGSRVDRGARLEISDAAGQHQNERVTLLFHKPADTPDDEPLLKILHAGNHWADDARTKTFKPTHRRGLQPANRLAGELAGMLVYSQEESVMRRLTRDENKREKEFTVEIDGAVTEDVLTLLRRGLSLDGVKLKAAQVSRQSDRQLRFVLRENFPQQIERMCELVGLRATRIRLIRIGSVSLGKLPAGQWRYLRENERF